MAIKLRVISDHYRELGEQRSRVFGVNGGTIGRAPDNDWVLPDPKRVVSGHHCEIEYRNGAYWIKDTSTNGVFVNDAEDPVSVTRPDRAARRRPPAHRRLRRRRQRRRADRLPARRVGGTLRRQAPRRTHRRRPRHGQPAGAPGAGGLGIDLGAQRLRHQAAQGIPGNARDAAGAAHTAGTGERDRRSLAAGRGRDTGDGTPGPFADPRRATGRGQRARPSGPCVPAR